MTAEEIAAAFGSNIGPSNSQGCQCRAVLAGRRCTGIAMPIASSCRMRGDKIPSRFVQLSCLLIAKAAAILPHLHRYANPSLTLGAKSEMPSLSVYSSRGRESLV